MTQGQLDKLFTSNLLEIEEYAIKASLKCFGDNFSHDILSELYIYLWENRQRITTKEQIISWSKTYIKNQFNWQDTPFKKAKWGRHSNKHDEISHEPQDLLENPTPTYEWMCELHNEFSKSLSRYDQRLFNIYTIKGLRKGKEFAKHIHISPTAAYILIKEAKEIEKNFRLWIEKTIVCKNNI